MIRKKKNRKKTFVTGNSSYLLSYVVLFLTGLILLFQTLNGLFTLLKARKIYTQKQKEMLYTYAKLASYKNQLDEVTSLGFRELFIKQYLQYYEIGEKYVVFKDNPPSYVTLPEGNKMSALQQWVILFTKGVEYANKANSSLESSVVHPAIVLE